MLVPLLLALASVPAPRPATARPPQAQRTADEAADLVAGLAARELFAQVEREARLFLERWPEDERAPLVRYRLGAALEELGRPDEALRWLEPLAGERGFAHAREALFRVGRARWARGDARGAAEAFERLLASAPGYLEDETRLACARALLALGEHADARARLEPLCGERRDALAGEALALAAWSALRSGRPEEARDLLERARRCEGEETRRALAAELGAEALLALERPAEALALLETWPEAERAPAHERLRGYACAALARHAEARACFERACARLEAEGAAQPGAREPAGKRDEAERSALVRELLLAAATEALLDADARASLGLLERRGARGGEDLAGALLRARAHERLGEPERALAALASVAGEGADEARARERDALRGDLLAQLGRHDEAAAAWVASGDARARLRAAAHALQAGRAADAAALAEQAWQAREGLEEREAGEAARLRGESELARERFEQALPWLEQAVARATRSGDDPSSRGLRARLAWARWQAGDPRRGARELEQLAEGAAGAERVELACLAGRAWAAAGEREAARAWLARAAAGEGERAQEARLALVELLPPAEARPHLEVLATGGGTRGARAALALAAEALEAGELERAETWYRAARDAAAGAEEGTLLVRSATHGLAWCALEDGRAAEAAELARAPLRGEQRALVRDDADGGDATGAVELARLWLAASARAGEAEGAAEALTELARRAPPASWLESALGALRVLAEGGARAEADALLGALEASAREAAAGGGDEERTLLARLLVERAFLGLPEADGSGAADLERVSARVEEALALAPRDASVLEGAFFAAEALREAGAQAPARAFYARAEALARLREHARVGRARCELSAGEAEAAERTLAAVLASECPPPLRLDALWLRARACAARGAAGEGRAALEELLTLAPPPALRDRARLELGEARAAAGLAREALAVLEPLVREARDEGLRARGELARARVLRVLGDPRAARAALERLLASAEDAARAPLRPAARLELSRVARSEGRAEEALGLALEVALLHEGQTALDALLEAAELLLERGERDAAAGRWRELLERAPASEQAARARALLAELEREQGSSAGARAERSRGGDR